eukprot:COSAG02_NODE_16018_length_1120_cov_1.711068_1_plen_158_part_00
MPLTQSPTRLVPSNVRDTHWCERCVPLPRTSSSNLSRSADMICGTYSVMCPRLDKLRPSDAAPPTEYRIAIYLLSRVPYRVIDTGALMNTGERAVAVDEHWNELPVPVPLNVQGGTMQLYNSTVLVRYMRDSSEYPDPDDQSRPCTCTVHYRGRAIQ